MSIGIDIIAVKRFSLIKKEDFEPWKLTFTQSEWRYAFKDSHSAKHLAGIFAAKEAVMKALGGTYVGRFNIIEITHTSDGAPLVMITHTGAPRVAVSISHTEDTAAAVAIIAG